MTATIDKQQLFIELRAEGRSFDEIAKRMNISKPTLIKWGKEFKDKIEEVSKVIGEQFIIEQKIKRTLRAQKLSEELDKAYEALKKTDYKNMSKKDLINIIEKIENKLSKLVGTNDDDEDDDTYKVIVQSRIIGGKEEIIEEEEPVIVRPVEKFY
jgi:hypothetical protein